MILVLSIIFPLSLVPIPTQAASDDQNLEIAYHWAPIHYQDTDNSHADADYLTGVDYDGDWNAQNNWEHQDDHPNQLKGEVYYSVVETKTHWFIVYSFYHPRDWEDGFHFFGRTTQQEHENDMEGVMEIVRKDDSKYGKFEGMVTIAHSDFYSFTPAGSPLKKGKEDIDGKAYMQYFDQSEHPTTFQEAKGHGLKAWNHKDFPGGDGVIYYPDKASGQVPKNGNDRFVKYKLVNTFAPNGLWDHRFDPQTFASWGKFHGDNGKHNAASPAWLWDDHDDKPGAGALALDPAGLTKDYFDGHGEFSTEYLSNPYIQSGLPNVNR